METRGGRRWLRLAGAVLAVAMVGAACGDDDEGSTDTTGSADTTGPADPTGPAGVDLGALDLDGDGALLVGVATPGPRDDGAYYQSLVEGVTRLADDNGWPAPIIVDNIPPADAATELGNLARQPGMELIAVGASEIADSLPALAEEFADVFWYCNCGAGAPPNDFYAQSQDDASEINYAAGYATGLLLRASDGDSVAFIGNQGFNFEVESSRAFEEGLHAVDPAFTLDVVNTGSFNDVPAATEAATAAIAAGADAIYPFLGGAHEAVVQLANDEGVITMSAGSSGACDRTDLSYQVAVKFDAADYLATIFDEILDGTLVEGDVRVFHVGVDPEPGATICDATPEQPEAMDEVYAEIASGSLGELFGQIKAEAYAG